ncbi:hypothetical protein [Mycoplasma enhydrae]|uniref:hypothetical protein n=1 Tax=Mycoplasma enhydrae TaxID=2499220 RepID=UPI00197BFBC3|nr:hypothetical protein [Mycoplasma enhydrae]MBN4089704.1 hypothetical protein [Mycoplasma enhydrae]
MHWSFFVCIGLAPILIVLIGIAISFFNKRNKIKIKHANSPAFYKFDEDYKKVQKSLNATIALMVLVVITAVAFAFYGLGMTYFLNK